MKSTEISRLLPEVYQLTLKDSAPLKAILEIMEGMQAPAEQVLGVIDRVFNPYSTPDRFVAYLGSWLDLERFYPSHAAQLEIQGRGVDAISPGTGYLREWVAAAATLSKWRGTAKGMQRCLEIATGLRGYSIKEELYDAKGMSRPFHIKVVAPASARQHLSLIERIIEQEKPAYVTSELEFETA